MSPKLRSLAVAGAMLALPALAQAQSAAGVNTSPAATWRLQLNADGSWYDNAYFGPTTEASTAWSTGGYATLSRNRRFRTGSFSLSVFGGMLYYPEIEDFTQPTYGGSFNLGWSASPRTHFSLSQRYSRANTRSVRSFESQPPPGNVSGSVPAPPADLTQDLPQDVPLPTSDYELFDTSLSLRQELSQSWHFSLGGSFQWRRYGDDQLSGGEQVSGSAELGHSFGKTTSMYLAYGYGASWFDENVTRSHQGLLGLRRQLSKGASISLGGGVGYLESTGSFYPAGNASLALYGRRSSFTLGYSRDFGQAFGYGRQTIGDLVSAMFSWSAARDLTFHAGYYFGYRRDALDETYTIRTNDVNAGFSWRIANDFGFSGNYTWQRNQTEGQPIVNGQRVTATLSYGVDWK